MNSLSRTGLLLKRDAVESYRSGLITAAAVAGVILVIYVVSAVINFGFGGRSAAAVESDWGHPVIFSIILILGGLIVASRAFHEAHDNSRNHEWFMLPAATLEKLASRVLLVTIGYTVIVLIGYFLTTALSAGISIILTGGHFGVFTPFRRDVLLVILHCWVVQTVFIVGAAYFRKHHFVRTVLSLIVIGIVLSIFAGVIFRIAFSGYFDGMDPTNEFTQLFEGFGSRSDWVLRFDRTAKTVRVIGEVVYWAFLAPVMLTAAYFRLRETEVSHGV